MSKHAPYYTISQAASRGGRFGAAVGVAIAIGVIATTGAAAIPLGAVGALLGGALGGFSIGLPLFAISNAVTHCIPGLSHSLGEDKAPSHLEDRHRAMRSGQYSNVTSPSDYAKMESAQNNTTAQDKLEQQRIAQMRLSGIS